MPANKELRSIRESAEQLEALRKKLGDEIATLRALESRSSGFWTVLANALSEHWRDQNETHMQELIDQFAGNAVTVSQLRKHLIERLAALSSVDVDTGKLYTLLEQMQRTDRESAEIVDRAAKVRVRLQEAAT